MTAYRTSPETVTSPPFLGRCATTCQSKTRKKHIVSGTYMSQKPNCLAMPDRAVMPAPRVWSATWAVRKHPSPCLHRRSSAPLPDCRLVLRPYTQSSSFYSPWTRDTICPSWGARCGPRSDACCYGFVVASYCTLSGSHDLTVM